MICVYLLLTVFVYGLFLVTEIALVKAVEAATVTCLVLSHLMHGVVDGVEVLFLGVLGDTHLVGVGTGLGVHTLLKVGLRIPYHVAEKFGEFGCMFSLFPCVTLESLGDLGIALAVSLTGHGQIHAYLGAFTVEVGVEVLDHLLVGTLGYAYGMLRNELKSCLFIHLSEF